MTRELLRTATVAFLLGVVGGCTCGPTDYQHWTYACAGGDDCVPGWTCVQSVCVPAGQGGGSGGGGGQDSPCLLDAGTPCYLAGLASPQLRYAWDGGAGCAVGHIVCGPTGDVCADEHVPSQEYCDGVDTSCTGVPDPLSCGCNDGLPCYQGRPYTIGANPEGKSRCRAGVWNCQLQPPSDQCQGEVLPTHETCNGLDDDCDGVVDNQPQTSPCGVGVCAAAFKACAGGLEVACDPATLAAVGYQPTEVCGDGLDNDCDGQVDEGCLCQLDAGPVACWQGPAAACPGDGGSCLGLCRRGTQACQALPDGGTGFGSCGGQRLPDLEGPGGTCTNGLDDDCDGLTDCEDPDCAGHLCGANGRSCGDGLCACTGNGGVAEAVETLCDDGKDNDCNGRTDCQEAACAGQGCGANGRTCPTDGGSRCDCSGNGGVPQPVETACGDGADNDCNGLVDCADTTACTGRSCAGGGTCTGGLCVPPRDAGTCVPTQARETSCNDGVDNDCDGLTDCADPDCNQQRCDPSVPTAVCCGVSGTTPGHCRDLATDPGNCGLCGLQCGSGRCLPVGTNPASGACTCASSTQCPRPSGYSRQTCRLDAGVLPDAGLCVCGGDNNSCGPSSAPDGGRGTRCTSANYCAYR